MTVAPTATPPPTHELRSPEQCKLRDNLGERAGRFLAQVAERIGLRYRLHGWQTRVRYPEIEIPIPHLPQALEGFRIAQVTDLHYTRLVVDADYERLFDEIAALEPDLYVFTGDNVGYDWRCIEPIVKKMGRLRAPYGSFAVLGNHDYWESAPETARCYAEHGIRLLVNEWEARTVKGATLAVAGLDDHVEGDPDLGAALHGIPESAPVVLLSHVPIVAQDPATARAGLILSGHVHGGLVNLPWYGPLNMPERSPRCYVQGLYHTPYSRMYLSAGIGTSVVWFRFLAPPEVPVLRLVRDPSTQPQLM